MSQFIIFSLSHQRAFIQQREAFAFSQQEITLFSHTIKSRLADAECLILSTCNRTDILTYMAPHEITEFFELLADFKKQTLYDTANAFKLYLDQHEALVYFSEVSAGLQSQILGDAQILNQLKQAYLLASKLDMIGTYIHRLVHCLFAANKKIANQTNFKRGISSVPYAAVDMASEYLEMLQNPRIGIIGFGEMGKNVCKHLISKGYRDLAVFNRSFESVEIFKQQQACNMVTYPLRALESELENFDVIISAPSVTEFLIEPAFFKTNVTNFKLLIDISLPRSINPDVTQVKGIIRLDIDDIRQVTDATKVQKEASKGAVKQILEVHLKEFIGWMKQHQKLGIIKELKASLQKAKAAELERLKQSKQYLPAPLHEEQLDAMIDKVIKQSAVALKSAKTKQEYHIFVNLITEIFLN